VRLDLTQHTCELADLAWKIAQSQLAKPCRSSVAGNILGVASREHTETVEDGLRAVLVHSPQDVNPSITRYVKPPTIECLAGNAFNDSRPQVLLCWCNSIANLTTVFWRLSSDLTEQDSSAANRRRKST
jgi:hypothetical protein